MKLLGVYASFKGDELFIQLNSWLLQLCDIIALPC